MTLLVARANVNGGWEKVGKIRLTKDGSRVVRGSQAVAPGSLAYHFARSAGKWIAGERIKPESIDFEHGSQKFRVSVVG